MTDSVQDPPEMDREPADRSDSISRSGKRASSRRKRRRRRSGSTSAQAPKAGAEAGNQSDGSAGEGRSDPHQATNRQDREVQNGAARRQGRPDPAGAKRQPEGSGPGTRAGSPLPSGTVEAQPKGRDPKLAAPVDERRQGHRAGRSAGSATARDGAQAPVQGSDPSAQSQTGAGAGEDRSPREERTSSRARRKQRQDRRRSNRAGRPSSEGAASAEPADASRASAKTSAAAPVSGKPNDKAAGPQDGPSGGDGGSQPAGRQARRGRRRRNRSRNGAERPSAPGALAQADSKPADGGRTQPSTGQAAGPVPAVREPAAAKAGTGQRERQPKPASRSPHKPRRLTGPGKRGPAGQGRYQGPLYAALDLGTNNCRLLIARPEDRGFRVVDAYSRIVRLGEGVGKTGLLSGDAMDRAVEALDNCQQKLEERGVARARLIATEACRAAGNGADFITRVKAETGMALEVVDRETEARLAVAGCVSLVDPEADGVILFDIGGGSSEIVWLDLRNRCGARGFALTRFIRSWTSLPVGVVTLAERHGGVDVTPAVFEAMVDDVSTHLRNFALGDDLSAAIREGDVHMLGTSGTVTTLAGVQLGLKRYDRRRVDGAWLDNTQVGEMIDRLRQMSYEERIANPCIGSDRADLVLAGCAILEAIRRRWECSRLRVADRGLREGILTELMAADGVWSKSRRRTPNSRKRGKT